MAAKRDLTTVQIGSKHLKKIDRIAKAKGVSRSAVVRWAIEAFDPAPFLEHGRDDSTVQPTQHPAAEPEPAVAL